MIPDAKIINELGGPAKVAEMLGYKNESGTQRVYNWTVRGIPAAVRLKNIRLFGNQAEDTPPRDRRTNQSPKGCA